MRMSLSIRAILQPGHTYIDSPPATEAAYGLPHSCEMDPFLAGLIENAPP